MTSDYSVAVPGSIGREKSRPINGVDEKVIYTFALWAFLSLIFLMPLLLGAGVWISLILLTLFLVWWAVFFKYLRSTKHIEKAILFFKYLLRTCLRHYLSKKSSQTLTPNRSNG
jgi:dolichol kinase